MQCLMSSFVDKELYGFLCYDLLCYIFAGSNSNKCMIISEITWNLKDFKQYGTLKCRTNTLFYVFWRLCKRTHQIISVFQYLLSLPFQNIALHIWKNSVFFFNIYETFMFLETKNILLFLIKRFFTFTYASKVSF